MIFLFFEKNPIFFIFKKKLIFFLIFKIFSVFFIFYLFKIDRFRNDTIRERVGVAPIVEKLVENRLRWFGHVERRLVDAMVRRVDQMEESQVKRGRGRPKKNIR